MPQSKIGVWLPLDYYRDYMLGENQMFCLSALPLEPVWGPSLALTFESL